MLLRLFRCYYIFSKCYYVDFWCYYVSQTSKMSVTTSFRRFWMSNCESHGAFPCNLGVGDETLQQYLIIQCLNIDRKPAITEYGACEKLKWRGCRPSKDVVTIVTTSVPPQWLSVTLSEKSWKEIAKESTGVHSLLYSCYEIRCHWKLLKQLAFFPNILNNIKNQHMYIPL